MLGGVFVATALTEIVKLVLLLRLPSLTVSVMVAVPVWPAAGVTVTIRFELLPPRAMPAAGTKVVFDELAVMARLPAAVSASPTVNANGLVADPALTV